MKRKFFALIMAAVLCLGMSTTAFAADATVAPNGSPEPTFAQKVYDNVTIAAGGGYLEKITDADMQQEILDRIEGEYDRLADYVYTFYPVEGADISYEFRVFASMFFAFDVQGVESGQVTVQLKDSGNFRVSNCVNRLVSVSHYDTEKQTWEVMDDFGVIDENGCITFAFDSYSPVLLSILNVDTDAVGDSENFTFMDTTYEPEQILTPEPPAGNGGQGGSGSGDNGAGTGTQNGTAANGTATGTSTAQTQATAPKTGDSNLGLIVLLAGAAAVCGAVLTRKKEA